MRAIRSARNTIGLVAVAIAALAATSPPPAAAAPDSASLWAALDGQVICGLAAHAPEAPAELLCGARSVPAPKHGDESEGDPGFVFLGATGNPRPALLSQYYWEREGGWESKNRATLKPGQKWSNETIGVTCRSRARAVRCANRSGHGFRIGKSSYRGF